ncbi:hypothetical protein FNV43_RR07551 [Rhamnella rubrinervis]|uniref:TF-B3 domain-containing protein n=1 Tax=Rhamnella rubrinervis TaxID=2594499 RepID=A0A8K0HEZ9_9ROSA|nr:hypothetical protein FNV43_RR07551 [Rhamnella rubrinervis]
MENSSSASFSSNITTSNETYTMTTHLRPTSMGGPYNSQFSTYEPLSLPSTAYPATSQYYYPVRYQLPPHENLQLAYTYPYLQAGQSWAYPAQPFMTGQNTALYGVPNPQPHVLSMEQERRHLDAWMTKVARSKRKMARQRSLSLTKNSAGSSSSTHADPRGLIVSGADTPLQNSNNNAHHSNLYSFCTPDKKRLRVLLKKELKNSDVGSLGRIVLPKREAEENLPILSDKEGIQVMIRDVYSYQEWGLKYKYWSNNKSRMYVLENTGDFVKQNGLEMGDSITLYEDECKNLVISMERDWKRGNNDRLGKCINGQNRKGIDGHVDDDALNSVRWATPLRLNKLQSKMLIAIKAVSGRPRPLKWSLVYLPHCVGLDLKERPMAEPSYERHSTSQIYNNNDANMYDINNPMKDMSTYDMYNTYEARDEEEASLALLIEQLKHKELQDANSLVTLSMEPQPPAVNNVVGSTTTLPASRRQARKAAEPSSSLSSSPRSKNQDFYDCYTGLGTLPEDYSYIFDHNE